MKKKPNIVLIIPTGIGCEIGGHAGDANPVVKLFASMCDTLITNPNAVNASDINEMPDNVWYTEGSILDRFLRGEIQLWQAMRPNKILLVVNAPVDGRTINSVSAARVTLGADIQILELDTELKAYATKVEGGRASGIVTGWAELVKQVSNYEFDALAIQSVIEVEKEVAYNYVKNGGVNPWGGVEAQLSKLIANEINKPVAHAPLESGLFGSVFKEVVDPRMSAEFVSVSYLHCVLKGLHRAPRIVTKPNVISPIGIDFLISPYGCIDEPHWACDKSDIPIIAVRENKTIYNNGVDGMWYGEDLNNPIIFVDNYLEAVGIVQSYSAGIIPVSVRRPIQKTKVIRKEDAKDL